MNTQTKILIVEDHEMIAKAWSDILQAQGYNVVGICATQREAVRMSKECNPQVVLMDINLKEGDGISATQEIKKNHDSIKVIALTMYNDQFHFNSIMDKGASGFVTKNSPKEELLKAIETVLKNEEYLCQEISSKVVSTEETLKSY
ncbi:MAG: response regulator transcription factor [Brumimicrobium sp.]